MRTKVSQLDPRAGVPGIRLGSGPAGRVCRAGASAQGLTVSPGTLADSLKRFVPLFEPLAAAILAHQNKAAPDTEPPLFSAPTTLDEVRPLDLRPVVRGTRESKLWNEFVARYHYLGYKTLVGAQMRYAVHDRNGWPLAMLGFSTAAWKLAPRDTFIGWTRQLREKNLPFVVDNPRFLILPWIKIPNLGSHILALIRRRLPDDWTERYNTTPVLIETFVETPRYTGAVYRASGWIHVGATQGRGRYDRDRQYNKPKKDVWLRPLRRDWKRTLNR